MCLECPTYSFGQPPDSCTVVLVLCDPSAAFDTVDLQILLSILKSHIVLQETPLTS